MRFNRLCLFLLVLIGPITHSTNIANATPATPTEEFATSFMPVATVRPALCSWEEQIQKTLHKLASFNTSNLSYSAPSLSCTTAKPENLLSEILVEISTSSQANAKAINQHGMKIVIASGLLVQITNPSELAYVLAHELAHLKLKHIPIAPVNLILTKAQQNHINNIRRSWEIQADHDAVNMLVCAGYDPTVGFAILHKLEQLADQPQGDEIINRIHLSAENRSQQLKSFIECSTGKCEVADVLATQKVEQQLG